MNFESERLSMKYETRVCIVYIVGCLITESEPRLVFDQLQGKRFIIDGKVQRTSVHVYDRVRKCYLTGKGNEGSFSLYDQGENCHLSLKIEFEEKKFNGYDHGTGNYFSGNVEENIIKFFDGADNRFFSFHLDE